MAAAALPPGCATQWAARAGPTTVAAGLCLQALEGSAGGWQPGGEASPLPGFACEPPTPQLGSLPSPAWLPRACRGLRGRSGRWPRSPTALRAPSGGPGPCTQPGTVSAWEQPRRPGSPSPEARPPMRGPCSRHGRSPLPRRCGRESGPALGAPARSARGDGGVTTGRRGAPGLNAVAHAGPAGAVGGLGSLPAAPGCPSPGSRSGTAGAREDGGGGGLWGARLRRAAPGPCTEGRGGGGRRGRGVGVWPGAWAKGLRTCGGQGEGWPGRGRGRKQRRRGVERRGAERILPGGFAGGPLPPGSGLRGLKPLGMERRTAGAAGGAQPGSVPAAPAPPCPPPGARRPAGPPASACTAWQLCGFPRWRGGLLPVPGSPRPPKPPTPKPPCFAAPPALRQTCNPPVPS